MGEDFTEPLLVSNDINQDIHLSDTESIWPNSASNAKFLFPSTDGSGNELCRLIHDPISNAINVVSYDDPTTRVVFDTIHPKDIIGCELQLVFHAVDFSEEYRRRREVVEEEGEMGVANVDSEEFVSHGRDDDENAATGTTSCALFPVLEKISSSKGVQCLTTTTTTDDIHHPDATAFLNIYCYPLTPSKSCFSLFDTKSNSIPRRHPQHRKLEVTPCQDFADARACVRAIRTLAALGQFRDWPRSPLRYLVVLNPNSGAGNAKTVYEEIVTSMLEQAGVEHDLCITLGPGCATRRMMTKPKQTMTVDDNVSKEEKKDSDAMLEEERDVSEYDAIIALGGDGILFEILQGIRTRSDRTALLSKLKFGIVGCGTCNGLAKSLLHASMERYGAIESMFLICKGQSTQIDLAEYRVVTKDEEKAYTAVLAFCYGLIADIDLESERLRWMGSMRLELWAVWRFVHLRTYRARFSYLPPPPSDETKQSGIVDLPLPCEPVPNHWVTMEEDFVLFWACQVSHTGYDVHSSPGSKLDDGLFHVWVIRKPMSRFKLLQFLLTLDSGNHVHDDKCEIYKCVAYRLEPLAEGSYNDLDGEQIESGMVQARVEPKAIHFFGMLDC